MLFLGIDDAGRGPILGPMIMAGVLLKEEDLKELLDLGVKDSKLLTPKKREELYPEITKRAISYKVVKIFPAEIDNKEFNLNQLEAKKSAEIMNFLTKSVKDKVHVCIDCPSVNIKSWSEYLMQHVEVKESKEFAIEHKADLHHVDCAAASILAKVTRDHEVEKIRKEIGIDFGSGYPADPKTKAFLIKYGEKYADSGIIRKTWETWNTLMKKLGQKKLPV